MWTWIPYPARFGGASYESGPYWVLAHGRGGWRFRSGHAVGSGWRMKQRRKAAGVSTVVSLLEEDESTELGLAREAEAAGAAAIEFIFYRFRIEAFRVLAEGMARGGAVARGLAERRHRGGPLQARGRRSGMLAAGTLIAAGWKPGKR